jgi:putative ABC transport system ATP-binding protein
MGFATKPAERPARIPAAVNTAIRMDSVTKIYGKGNGTVTALNDVSVSIPRGTFTAVMGPSGSGKSTFLHCAAGLDRPTSGSVFLGPIGTDLSKLSEAKLSKLRRERIGFVFQAFNLVSALNVQHNITLPLRLAGRRADRAHLTETLARVGLSERARHLPSQLSGGEQQRVAIARALITRPEVLFADEPTGALDTMTAREIIKLLRQTVDTTGQTVVMVTHDPVAASCADSVLFLADGRIVEVAPSLSATEIAAHVTRPGAWA